jgi:hypothetical protein
MTRPVFTKDAKLMTSTQLLAQASCQAGFGFTDDDVAKSLTDDSFRTSTGHSALDLIMILQIMMQVIQTLIDNCPAEFKRLKAAVRKPSWYQRSKLFVLTWRQTAGTGYQRYTRRIADGVMSACAAADDELLNAVWDENTNTVNQWLI